MLAIASLNNGDRSTIGDQSERALELSNNLISIAIEIWQIGFV
jgi:hypothetical protein